MTHPENMIDIASRVLEEARYLDDRIRLDSGTIGAWARCFTGQKVYPTEALEAVHLYYRRPDPYPIKPGDIIAHCEAQPVWSSAEHVNGFLDQWANFPYATVIQDYSGMAAPDSVAPDTVPRDEHRDYLVSQLRAWISANRADLVEAIIRRRHRAVEQ
ncbi:hypothetical protein ACFPPE_07450 [Agromyces tardus]|uniref:hypothetical protein n=1 Tax=Agromyces tardus TaxID=2583849 RepID=UPI00361D4662